MKQAISLCMAAAVVLVAVVGSSFYSADGATIRKRSTDSAAALRSLADTVKALNKKVNDAYCSSIWRSPPGNASNSTLACKKTYDDFKGDKTIPSPTNIADNQVVNKTTLLTLLNDTQQMNHTLTSTQRVVYQSLMSRGCLPGEQNYCALICSIEKQAEKNLTCALNSVLARTADLILKLQQETNCFNCLNAKYVDVDITPSDAPHVITTYDVIVMQYAVLQSEAASKATHLYQG